MFIANPSALVPQPLSITSSASASASVVTPLSMDKSDVGDKVNHLNVSALQEQIRSKLAQDAQILAPLQARKPIPLILDAEGRTIDESGREINVP